MTEHNKPYVIIHGHFYQPPREDPWTLEIDRQPSAFPYRDWNERIDHECYAANAASRIIDSTGKIEDIVNNYESLSFNFGPTLLNWIREKDPNTYKALKEADRVSMELNNGHGNAVAQVYNHIIMPLADNKDAWTQIIWGIESFKRDFERYPEGMWLAETAINETVADMLVQAGIKFIILSPTQAKEIMPIHNPDLLDWKDVSDNSIDPSQPYSLKLPSGNLNIFFYYMDIASKISFQHLLQNVDYLRGEILSHKGVNLIHTATDGESYGHHEPFGDMCLSRLIYENRRKHNFIFTNYARYLEIHPPVFYVRLKEGNENLGTAWSCAHGVDRWRKDCGCSTGGLSGWNQKWREPLREAFDFLRDRLFQSAENALKPIFPDIWQARNAYINAADAPLEEREKLISDLFTKFALKTPDKNEKEKVIRIMEALKYGLLMYTSCGWFFTEISGIETVQDLRYASKLMELTSDILPPDTHDQFLEILSRAESNIKEYQNGKWIFQNFVEKYHFPEQKVINEFLIGWIVDSRDLSPSLNRNYYHYLLNIQNIEVMAKGNWQVYRFVINLENRHMLEKQDYIAYIFSNGYEIRSFIRKIQDESLRIYLDKLLEKSEHVNVIRDFQEWFTESYSLQDMSYDAKTKIVNQMFRERLSELHRKPEINLINVEEYLNILNVYHDLGLVLPAKDIVAMKELLNTLIIQELNQFSVSDLTLYDFTGLIRVIQTVRKSHLQLDYDEMMPFIRDFVLKNMIQAVSDLNLNALKQLDKIIDFTNVAGLDFEKYEIQNLLYYRLKSLTGENKIDPEALKLLMKIASKFNLSTLSFEKEIMDSSNSLN